MDKTPDELAPGTRVVTAPELDNIGLGRLGRCPNKPGEVDRKGERFYHIVHDDNTYAPYLRDELTPAPAQPDELAPGARVVTAPAQPDELAPGTRVVTAPELDPSEDFGAYRCPNKPGEVRENVVLAPSYRAVNHDDGTSAIYLCAELRAAPTEPVPDGHAAIPTEAGVYLYGDPSANKPGVAQLSVYETAPMHVWAVIGSAAEISHELMTERVQRNGWVFSRLDKPWPPSPHYSITLDSARPLLDRVSRHIEHAIDQGAVGVHVITIGDEIEAQGFGEIDEADLVYALERSKLEVLRTEREPSEALNDLGLPPGTFVLDGLDEPATDVPIIHFRRNAQAHGCVCDAGGPIVVTTQATKASCPACLDILGAELAAFATADQGPRDPGPREPNE